MFVFGELLIVVSQNNETASAAVILVFVPPFRVVQRIGFDPVVTSILSHKAIDSVLMELPSPKKFVPVSENLVDAIWKCDGRPPAPHTEVFVQLMEHTGQSVEDKVANLRAKLQEENVHGIVLSVWLST